jgi:MoxR-like ATPase
MRIKVKKYEKSYKFIFSKTAIRNIFRIICASETKLSLNLKGPPGIGKSAICEVASQILKKKFVRICCSESMQL